MGFSWKSHRHVLLKITLAECHTDTSPFLPRRCSETWEGDSGRYHPRSIRKCRFFCIFSRSSLVDPDELHILPQPNNPLAHYYGTGPEIIEAVTATPSIPEYPSSGKVDVLIAGAGTGGTISVMNEVTSRVNFSQPKVTFLYFWTKS